MTRFHARIGLLLFALLLAVCLTAIDAPDTGAASPVSATASAPAGQADLILYQAVVEGVRSGTPYYSAAADAYRIAHVPLPSFLAVRLPTLTVIQDSVPAWTTHLALLVLCAGTAVAWAVRVHAETTRPAPAAMASLLVLLGLYMTLDPGVIVLHEAWAGPLIALSLAVRRPGVWMSAVALGLSAMLIRETALLYVAIMAVVAWVEGERREAAGWAGAMLVFAGVLAAHAHAVGLVTGPLDRVSLPHAPGAMQGVAGYVRLVTDASGLVLLPQWAASLVLGTAAFGWAAWRDPTATRAIAVLVGYAAIIAVLVRGDADHWPLITTPALLVGLIFAVDGLRDLIVAASDTRRITVTRIIR